MGRGRKEEEKVKEGGRNREEDIITVTRCEAEQAERAKDGMRKGWSGVSNRKREGAGMGIKWTPLLAGKWEL